MKPPFKITQESYNVVSVPLHVSVNSGRMHIFNTGKVSRVTVCQLCLPECQLQLECAYAVITL